MEKLNLKREQYLVEVPNQDFSLSLNLQGEESVAVFAGKVLTKASDDFQKEFKTENGEEILAIVGRGGVALFSLNKPENMAVASKNGVEFTGDWKAFKGQEELGEESDSIILADVDGESILEISVKI